MIDCTKRLIKNVLGGQMSNTISQKAAVVNEVNAILGSNFDSSLTAKEQLTNDQISTIKANIFTNITNGLVSYSKELNDEKELTRYISGMISNHFRKSKELNGGNSYTPTNSGRGARDTQLSELSKLLGTYTEGTEEFSQIVSAIDSRKIEIAAEKSIKSTEKKRMKDLAALNTDALPDGMKALAENLVNGIS